MRAAWAAAVVATCISGVARAHDYWLAPTAHALAREGEVGVSILVGERLVHEEDRPMEVERTPRIDVIDARGTRDLRPLQKDGAVPAMRIPLVGDGGHLLVADRVPAFVELPPAKFETYLREEGLDAIVEERARRGESALPGREQYRRNLKALFQVGDARDDVHARVTGQALELVAETPPAFAAPGDALTMRLTFRGAPRAGHRVEAVSRAVGDGGVSIVRSAAYTTDADGRVRIAIDRHGEWLVRAVHMIRCEGDCLEDAAWESHWAAYTFGNPARAATASPASGGGGVPMLAVIGGAAALAVGVGVMLARRRR